MIMQHLLNIPCILASILAAKGNRKQEKDSKNGGHGPINEL